MIRALAVLALLATPAVARADGCFPDCNGDGKPGTAELDGVDEAEGCDAGDSSGRIAGALVVVGAAALAVGRRRKK